MGNQKGQLFLFSWEGFRVQERASLQILFGFGYNFCFFFFFERLLQPPTSKIGPLCAKRNMKNKMWLAKYFRDLNSHHGQLCLNHPHVSTYNDHGQLCRNHPHVSTYNDHGQLCCNHPHASTYNHRWLVSFVLKSTYIYPPCNHQAPPL